MDSLSKPFGSAPDSTNSGSHCEDGHILPVSLVIWQRSPQTTEGIDHDPVSLISFLVVDHLRLGFQGEAPPWLGGPGKPA